jgi:hypothetical membrane protein
VSFLVGLMIASDGVPERQPTGSHPDSGNHARRWLLRKAGRPGYIEGDLDLLLQWRNLPCSRRLILLAPPWFALVIVLAGMFTPGYSHLGQAISELAAPGAPLALFVQYAGFVPLAFAVLLFARDMRRSHPGTHLVAGLFFITGLTLLVAGIFPTDEFGRRITFSGKIHAIAGIILMLSACLAPLAVAWVGKGGRGLRLYSLISGLALVLLFVFLPNGISPALIQMHKTALGGFFDFWYANHGLCQRLIFAVYFVWLEVYILSFALQGGNREPHP